MNYHLLQKCFAISIFLGGATQGLCKPLSVSVTVSAPRTDQDLFDGSKRPPPLLPAGAAGKNLSGQVELQVESTKLGTVQAVTVMRSSGSKLLDEAARTWARYVWRYPQAAGATVHQETINFRTTANDRRNQAQGAMAGRSIYPNTPRPPYPYLARRLGWHGGVDLTLLPDGQGNVKEARIFKSSGVPLLDLIAKAYAESYWKLPGNEVTECLITFQLP